MRAKGFFHWAVFVVLFVGALLWSASPARAFSGVGEGTEGEPYRITTCLQLQEMNDDLGASYRLANDINCGPGAPAGNNTRLWNENPDAPGEYFGFEPIGNYALSEYFQGSLDGNNKTISGLYVNRPTEVSAGLFDIIYEGNVADLTLDAVHAESGYFVGGLGGLIGLATIENVRVVGESEMRITEGIAFPGAPYPPLVGGLMGFSAMNTIVYGFSEGLITGLAEEGIYGGLVGGNQQGYIVASASKMNVVARGGYLGGFMGINVEGMVGGSYSTGYVMGLGGQIGGFVGYNQSMMTDNYSLATVVVPAPFEGGRVGGFAGVNSGSINNSYFAGSLSISSYEDPSDEGNVGAFVGLDNGTTQQSFWNTEVAGDWLGCGAINGDSCIGIFGKTTAELKTLSTFTTDLLTPWDFENIWDMNGIDNQGYPFFRWHYLEDEEEEEEEGSESTPGLSTAPTLPQAPVCTDAAPAAPDLFQITVVGTTATLYFTPLSDTNTYYISYSEQPSAEEHGVEVSLGREGVQSYTVEFLKPEVNYYFKVRGQHGCMPGNWSAIKATRAQLPPTSPNQLFTAAATPSVETNSTPAENPPELAAPQSWWEWLKWYIGSFFD